MTTSPRTREHRKAAARAGLTYVTVTAPDLSDPAVISWMHDFEQRVTAAAVRLGVVAGNELDEEEVGDLVELTAEGRIGEPRSTLDLDLMIACDADSVRKLVGRLQEAFYVDESDAFGQLQINRRSTPSTSPLP